MAKIAIIIGSIREGRLGGTIAEWVYSYSQHREHTYSIIDLKEFALPLLTAPEPPISSGKRYSNAEVQRWSDAVDAVNAFIFITPEYNHSVPGAFKNAIDSLGMEWVRKPVALVGYGYGGASGAMQAWRQIFDSKLKLDATEAEVNLDISTVIKDGKFAENDDVNSILAEVLAELESKLPAR
ncbi:MAG: NAD(P)H-dependent oxidoreductase [Corynebacterium sp.]|nr:NAD(P)H-dependent oxidoreductase [Corynebacterium sp.]